MEEMSQKLRSLNDPWPWACEIGVRVHNIHTVIAYRWKISPTGIGRYLPGLIGSFFQTKAARHDYHDLRPPLENILPQDANGIGPLTPEFVDSPSNLDHFRHPMTTAIDGVDPFHAKDPRPRRCVAYYGRDLL